MPLLILALMDMVLLFFLLAEASDCTAFFPSPTSRSYGSVFKAIHKESGQVVAIKQVPVESDLQEIIKEISIMQQCDRYARHLFF